MPFSIYWGKYAGRSTLEELMFDDFGYPWWMLREFDAEDDRVVHIRHLIDVSSKAPIVVPCDGDSCYKTACNKSPNSLSVAKTEGHYDVKDAWFVCDDERCRMTVSVNSNGSCGRLGLSFEGLTQFISYHNPTRYVIHEFTQKLAQAWGLLNSHGHLRKKAIFEFFANGKAS